MLNSYFVPPPPPGFEPVSAAPSAPAPPSGFEPLPTPESRSWTERNITDPLARGWNAAKAGGAVLAGEIGLGVGDTEFTPDEVARRLVEYQADSQRYPVQPDVQAGLDAIQASSTVLNALAARQFAASLRRGGSVDGMFSKQYAWQYHR